MTASSHRKMYKQLKNKPVKLQKYKRFNAPKKRTTGVSQRPCKVCGRVGGHVQAYGLHLCRQCFRDYAYKIGFKKYH